MTVLPEPGWGSCQRRVLLSAAFLRALALAAPLVAGAGLKIVYDLLLFAAFRRLRRPEEGGTV